MISFTQWMTPLYWRDVSQVLSLRSRIDPDSRNMHGVLSMSFRPSSLVLSLDQMYYILVINTGTWSPWFRSLVAYGGRNKVLEKFKSVCPNQGLVLTCPRLRCNFFCFDFYLEIGGMKMKMEKEKRKFLLWNNAHNGSSFWRRPNRHFLTRNDVFFLTGRME